MSVGACAGVGVCANVSIPGQCKCECIGGVASVSAVCISK